MSSITCKINFDNNREKLFYSGQCLRGTVKLILNKEKTVRSIYLQLAGRAYARWMEGSNRSHTGTEEYLMVKTYLLGGPTGGKIHLHCQTYDYAFEFELPSNLPSSIEAGVGHIRYTASVVLDSPRWLDRGFEVPFLVVKPLDLSSYPELREASSNEINKKFFKFGLLFCCISAPLKINAKTEFGGYAPGQKIHVEIHATNRSPLPVAKFNVKLIKQIDMYEGEHSFAQHSEKRCITKCETRGCSVNGDELIQASLDVPTLTPTDQSSSKIIKISYFIRVNGLVEGFHIKPTVELPITIGTSPIENVGSEQFLAFQIPYHFKYGDLQK